MRKLTSVGLLFIVLVLAVVLSGCFNTPSMLSYEFYSQSTPASVTHVYVKVETIEAANIVTTYNVDKTVDLVRSAPEAIVSNVAVSKPPLSIPYLRFTFGPVATVVYSDTSSDTVATMTFKLKTSTVYFYNYSTQQMQRAPLKINGMGQNKIALVMWNLSEFSTPSTKIVAIDGQAFEKDELLKVNVKYKVPMNGVYYASISDSMNPLTATYKFTKKCAESNYNQLNNEYEFLLYAFKAPVSTYMANINVSTATQTVASTEISLGSADISVVLP